MSERQIRHFASDIEGQAMCGEPFETRYAWTTSGPVHDCSDCVTAFRAYRRRMRKAKSERLAA